MEHIMEHQIEEQVIKQVKHETKYNNVAVKEIAYIVAGVFSVSFINFGYLSLPYLNAIILSLLELILIAYLFVIKTDSFVFNNMQIFISQLKDSTRKSKNHVKVNTSIIYDSKCNCFLLDNKIYIKVFEFKEIDILNSNDSDKINYFQMLNNSLKVNTNVDIRLIRTNEINPRPFKSIFDSLVKERYVKKNSNINYQIESLMESLNLNKLNVSQIPIKSLYISAYSDDIDALNTFERKINHSLLNSLSIENQRKLLERDQLFLSNKEIEKYEDCFKLNDEYYSCINIHETDDSVSPFWLLDLSNYTDYLFTVDMRNYNSNVAYAGMKGSIEELDSQLVSDNTDAISGDIAYEEKERLKELGKRVKKRQEQIKKINIKLWFKNKDKEKLLSNIDDIVNELTDVKSCKVGIPKYNMLYEIKNYSIPNFHDKYCFDIENTAIAIGFPHNVSILDDVKGIFMSLAHDNGFTMFNPFYNDEIRKGFDMSILGRKNAGKSVMLDFIILTQHLLGTNIVSIDFENTKKDLFDMIGGVNISPQSEFKFNVMQIFNSSINSDDEMLKEYSGSNININIQRLVTFFSYFNDFSKSEKSILSNLLKQFYNDNNITDSNYLEIERFPILEDFYYYLRNKVSNNYFVDIDGKKYDAYQQTRIDQFIYDFLLNIQDLVIGAGAEYFNNETNFKMTKHTAINILLKDITKSLGNNAISQAYFEMILQIFLWFKMDLNKSINDNNKITRDNYMNNLEKVQFQIFAVDESHYLYKSNETILLLIYRILKQSSKCFTSFIDATHNLSEHLPSESDENKDILNTMWQLRTYKIIMRQDSSAYKLFKDTYRYNSNFDEQRLNSLFNFGAGDFLADIDGRFYEGNLYINNDVAPFVGMEKK